MLNRSQQSPVALILFCLAACLPAHADSENPAWSQDWDAILASAQADDRPLLIDFTGTDWCGACRILDARVFSKEAFTDPAADRFVLGKVVKPRGPATPEAQALMEEYSITNWPTIYVMTPEGVPVTKIVSKESEQTPESYLALTEEAMAVYDTSNAHLAAAEQLEGLDKARRMVQGLELIEPEIIATFWQDAMATLAECDPDDTTGYQAFIKARENVRELIELKSSAFKTRADELWEDASVTGISRIILASYLYHASAGGRDIDKAIEYAQALAATEPVAFDRSSDFQLHTTAADAASVLEAELAEHADFGRQAKSFLDFNKHLPIDLFMRGCGRKSPSARVTLEMAYTNWLWEEGTALAGKERAVFLAEGIADTSFYAYDPLVSMIFTIQKLDADTFNTLSPQYQRWSTASFKTRAKVFIAEFETPQTQTQ